jgi:hypothetical protein
MVAMSFRLRVRSVGAGSAMGRNMGAPELQVKKPVQVRAERPEPDCL